MNMISELMRKNLSSFFLIDNLSSVLFFLAVSKPERFRKQLDQQAYARFVVLSASPRKLSWSRDICLL